MQKINQVHKNFDEESLTFRSSRYCAIVNPIRRHVAGLSAKPLTILTASLIWLFAFVLAMPDALFSYVPTIDLGGNRTILICSPFPEEFGNYGVVKLDTLRFDTLDDFSLEIMTNENLIKIISKI